MKRRDLIERIESLTPCPECGCRRWRRWAYVWRLGDQDERRWMPVAVLRSTNRGCPLACIDWPALVARASESVDGFEVCCRCGLVVR